MSRRSAVAIGLALASLLGLGIVIAWKGIAVWPAGSDAQRLAAIVGANAAPWLEGAEVVAWQPDPNWKPQSYFAVRAMSRDDFRLWAAAAGLEVSQTPGFASGVFALPDGVTLSRWPGKPAEGAAGLDAQGTTSSAVIWSRWGDGLAYTVVHPTY